VLVFVSLSRVPRVPYDSLPRQRQVEVPVEREVAGVCPDDVLEGTSHGPSGDLLTVRSATAGVSSDRWAVPVDDNFASVGYALGAVEELAPHGADPPFRVRVRDGRAWWGADDGRAVASEDLVGLCCIGAGWPWAVRVAG
jgi:hypothetical protein